MTRVLISADMEGATGTVSPADVEAGTPRYERFRRLLTQDVNAAVAGFADAGAEEIVVNDPHCGMDNVLIEELDPRAVLIVGRHKPLGMMEGLEDGIDAVAFVGYHTGAGEQGVLAHTYLSHSILGARIDGEPVGEGGFNALVAAEAGVPVVLVTGDDLTCREAAGYAPGCRTVAVKRAISRHAAVCRTPAVTAADIRREAAAESEEPERSVARATTGIIWRIILFYVGSIVLVVTIVPWDSAKVLASPYVAAWNIIGLPGAGVVMDVVILTAVLSVLNSSVYVSSRMLRALATHGDAPTWLVATNKRRVPARAILAGTVVGWISVLLAYLSPDTVFTYLVNSSGAVAIFMYLMIGASQLRMRRRLEREAPERLTLRMWLFPYLTWVVMAGFAAVLVAMAVIADQRTQLLTSVGSLAVVLVAYAVRRARGGRPAGSADAAERAAAPVR